MGLSAALASSSIGRSIVKAYMDDAARELIKSLIEFAELTEGSKTSRAFEKGTSILTLFVSFTLSSSPLPPPFFLFFGLPRARAGRGSYSQTFRHHAASRTLRGSCS